METRTTKAFDRFLEGLDPRGREEALAALEREAASLARLAPGPDRAREVHARVEEALARFAGLRPEVVARVRCGKGCSHCCRMWVGVTGDEADLLARRVAEGTARPDLRRMALQAPWGSPAEFMGRPREEADCVFLGADGACTVYEDRPSICRAVLVASDPELCRTGGLDTRITAVINPYVEVVVSAALTVDAREAPCAAAGRNLAAELARRLQGAS
jgi:Fe-S-cluster containining protein